MRVSLVAAVARNGVIGRDGAIPWHLPEDMARFRELTMGHAVVMGRRTWDSLPDRFRPLPGRRNMVVTRNPGWSAEGAERAGSLEDALTLVEDDEHVFVIGGAELYSAALPRADELRLTEVDLDVEGDAFFPQWDRAAFAEVSREEHVSSDGAPFAFATYRRSDASHQLAALASVADLFAEAGIEYWLFGGWAVDFYAGAVTRPHDDLDIAVWRDDVPQIDALLKETGWSHAPEAGEDGGTGYERDAIRLELTYLVRCEGGQIATPLRNLEAPWPEGAFAADTQELLGVRVRLIAVDALAQGKASPRDGADDAAKDAADFDVLSGF